MPGKERVHLSQLMLKVSASCPVVALSPLTAHRSPPFALSWIAAALNSTPWPSTCNDL